MASYWDDALGFQIHGVPEGFRTGLLHPDSVHFDVSRSDEYDVWRPRNMKCTVNPVFDEPIHTPSQRVDGPRELTDGALRPDRVLWTWPMIIKRAVGSFEEQLFNAHRPFMDGAKTRPRCAFCECVWPCDNVEVILEHFGLTEHDFDFRPEDNGASGL